METDGRAYDDARSRRAQYTDEKAGRRIIFSALFSLIQHHSFVINGGPAIFSDFDDKAYESTVSEIIDQAREDVELLMELCWEVNRMGF